MEKRGWFKNMVRNWLDIQSAQDKTIVIREPFSYESNLAKNIIWFRGDPSELHQLYDNIDDGLNNITFWAAKPSKGLSIRKIHTGLPSLIARTLTKVVVNNLDSINVLSDEQESDKKLVLSDEQEIWNEISKDNKFKKLIKTSLAKVLYQGDGAFKISYDLEISKYPIIEFYGADRVEYITNRGRCVEVIFKTNKVYNKKDYILKDHYTKTGITYTLEDLNGKEIEMSEFNDETRELKSKEIINPCELMMAIPFMIEESPKFEGRGKSIFDGKEGSFDSYDEVWSQWIESVRRGRMNKYIPDNLIPRDPDTGECIKPNSFDNDFIKIEASTKEADKNEIKTSQGLIPSEELLSAYVTALDLCLQGLISPSTIGIDSKKIDNAEAQREKEKTTLYSRDEIVDSLQEVLKEVVNVSLKAYKIAQSTLTEGGSVEIPENYTIDVQFGEYANPSFEAQVETVGKAAATNTMSIEAQVEELWGDTKDDKWKKEEVNRIKNEKGIIEMPEPSINKDLELTDEVE